MWNDFKIIRVMGVITVKRILIDAVLCIFQRDESTSLDNSCSQKYNFKSVLYDTCSCGRRWWWRWPRRRAGPRPGTGSRSAGPIRSQYCDGQPIRGEYYLDQPAAAVRRLGEERHGESRHHQLKHYHHHHFHHLHWHILRSQFKQSCHNCMLQTFSWNKHGIRMRLFDFDLFFASGC